TGVAVAGAQACPAGSATSRHSSARRVLPTPAGPWTTNAWQAGSASARRKAASSARRATNGQRWATAVLTFAERGRATPAAPPRAPLAPSRKEGYVSAVPAAAWFVGAALAFDEPEEVGETAGMRWVAVGLTVAGFALAGLLLVLPVHVSIPSQGEFACG